MVNTSLKLLILLILVDWSYGRLFQAWPYYNHSLRSYYNHSLQRILIKKRVEPNSLEIEQKSLIQDHHQTLDQMIRQRKIFLPNHGSFDPWGG